jgi:hypothetical protein
MGQIQTWKKMMTSPGMMAMSPLISLAKFGRWSKQFEHLGSTKPRSTRLSRAEMMLAGGRVKTMHQ